MVACLPSHLVTASTELRPKLPGLNTNTFSTTKCSPSDASLKILQDTPDGCQQGWSCPANAKLLNPILIATALKMKPETVCKSLCVLPSVVSHISKYCRWRRKCVEEEQTQWSRALPHFRRGRPPILCCKPGLLAGSPICFGLKPRSSPLLSAPWLPASCVLRWPQRYI